MPKRIQLSRRPGWRLADHSDNAVIVDRRTKWGNPYKVVGQGGRWYVLNTIRNVFIGHAHATKAGATRRSIYFFRDRYTNDTNAPDPRKLRGKDVACWCDLDAPCHGDVLLELANEVTHEQET